MLFDDLKLILRGIEHYRSADELPENSKALDLATARVIAEDPFDQTALEWKRIGEYEREINASDWSKAS